MRRTLHALRAGRARVGPQLLLSAVLVSVAPALVALPAHADGLRLAGFDVVEQPARSSAAASQASDGSGTPSGNGSGQRQAPRSDRSGASRKGEVDRLIDEFMSTSEAIEGREGDEPVPMDRTGGGKPALYSVLQVTKDDNPLLTKRCMRQATEFSVERLEETLNLERESEGFTAAAKHIEGHIDQIAKRGGRISYSQYLRTIANCREFCAPLVAHLVECHKLSVARLDHGIVLFGFDRYELDSRYVGERGLLTKVIEKLQADHDQKVLLVGRASKIGDLRYNRRLSAQRTLEIRDALVERGISRQRIETTWFGWEPPQVTEKMAREYGLQDLYERLGRQKLNQSVMVVLYSPQQKIDARTSRPGRTAVSRTGAT